MFGSLWKLRVALALNYLVGEDTPDNDVRRILATLVDIAVQYVLSEARLLGFPSITLTTPAGEVVFRRSLVDNLMSIFRRS